jgi:hypothetical protein
MPSRLTTTLYDLITAIQAVVDPDDDALVVATVVHLLRSGRLTWHGKARYNGDASQATRLLTGRLGAVSWGGDIGGEGLPQRNGSGGQSEGHVTLVAEVEPEPLTAR